MPGLDSFLWGGPAALVVAAAAFAGAHWATRRPSVAWHAGVVAGFAAGTVALDAHANGVAAAASRLFKPAEAHNRLALLALATVAPSLVAAATGRRWTTWLLAAPIAALAPWWLLRGGRYLPSQELREAGFTDGAWSAGQAAAILGGVAAAIVAAWWLWRRTDATLQPRLRAALAALTIGGAGAAVACTGSITYAHALALLSLAVAACGAAAWILRARSGPEAAAGPILVLAGSLLVLAVGYSELHLWQAAVLAAVIAVAAGWLPSIDRRPTLAAAAIRTALVIIPLAAVVVPAAAKLAASQLPGHPDATSDPYSAYQ